MKTWDEARRRAEVLRYLRYRGGAIDPESEALVASGMEQVRAVTHPRELWRIYDLAAVPGGLRLPGTTLMLPGQHIARHLQGCDRAALLAATLGAELDALLRQESRRDMTRAVILDAAASQYIEEICDAADRLIQEEAAREGRSTTLRFSPGFGDLPLDLQPLILTVLDAPRRIGLTATASNLLLPQKSVTAIIGLKNPGTA
jgi:hypothetical protein